uniref:Uncharacterized protein n=1 Tax=Anguilla anguilla TaxID=7936 RepID=A0A0E9X5X2_ANGAN
MVQCDTGRISLYRFVVFAETQAAEMNYTSNGLLKGLLKKSTPKHYGYLIIEIAGPSKEIGNFNIILRYHF